MKRKFLALVLAVFSMVVMAGCGQGAAGTGEGSAAASAAASTPGAAKVSQAQPGPVTLLVAAAASLEYSFKEQLIPMFRQKYPWVTVEGTYDSSGKLQTQMEEGMQADVFMSAAMKQMNALEEKGLIEKGSAVPLLENQLVLIVPAKGESAIKTFADVDKAQHLALGDPESVPAGQYAKEALTNLGLWDKVQANASYGTNVTEVLGWVAAGSADAGLVYATDAATNPNVTVVQTAPAGSLAQKVLYPVGVVAGSAHKTEAALFVEFLQSPEALKVFEDYGFTPNQ